MNDYARLLQMQTRRAKMKAALDALDDEIRALAGPMRAALKLPGRSAGRPRGSIGMDRVITTLREAGPLAVGALGDRLGMKRTAIYKLVDKLKAKGAVRASADGMYELAPGYEPGTEEDGTAAKQGKELGNG